MISAFYLTKKHVKWSTVSYALALAYQPYVSTKEEEEEINESNNIQHMKPLINTQYIPMGIVIKQ